MRSSTPTSGAPSWTRQLRRPRWISGSTRAAVDRSAAMRRTFRQALAGSSGRTGDGPDAVRGAIRLRTAAGSRAGRTERHRRRASSIISANPGEDLRPLARIASGGELSRIMLALKTLAAAATSGQDADLRRGRRRHRRARRRRRRREAAAARRERSRCSASRTCRRSPRTATTHFQIEKRVRARADAYTRVARLERTEDRDDGDRRG